MTVSENLSPELKKSVQKILTNIYEEETGQEIWLGADGWFRQGVLAGRADKTGEAEFVGILARQKRKEQKIQELELLIRELEDQMSCMENELQGSRNVCRYSVMNTGVYRIFLRLI